MFDILQVCFWSVTYLLIVIYGFRDKQMRMPLLAGAMNFTWEANALLYAPHWSHVLWLGLDVLILAQNMRYIARNGAKSAQYISLLAALFGGLYALFRLTGGMLISVFTIDLIMAAEYVLCADKLPLRGKVAIGFTKCLGDLFAWIAYSRETKFVVIVGAVVLGLNLFYLYCCLEESIRERKK